MTVLSVRHITHYAYRTPVRFGDHRMMFRPRDSYDQRLLSSELVIAPEPRRLHWIHDVFGNCVGIARFDKPIVAAVQGLAVGVGTTMLFHCDLVYAAPDARFVMPFVNLGIVPEAASSLLAPATLGYAKAAAMLLLGEPMDAEAADKAGLVTAIVPADRLQDHARAKAAALTRQPPQSLAYTRRLMKGDSTILAERIEEEGRLFQETMQSAEAKEAFTAFLEKRPPVFQRKTEAA